MIPLPAGFAFYWKNWMFSTAQPEESYSISNPKNSGVDLALYEGLPETGARRLALLSPGQTLRTKSSKIFIQVRSQAKNFYLTPDGILRKDHKIGGRPGKAGRR